MTNRHVDGDMGGGTFVTRTSRPGYDVLTEPLGSSGISFDSRLTDIGTVVAAGLIQCGGSPVYFPEMNYVPIVQIFPWDGTYLDGYNQYINWSVTSPHIWIPAIALVSTSYLQVIAYTNPWFDVTLSYNPTGTYFLYFVLAAG